MKNRYALLFILMVVLAVARPQSSADPDVPFYGDLKKPVIQDTSFEERAPEVKFSGSLIIRSDNGDSLPVYINNQRVGVTPYRADNLPVGRYSVAFMRKGLRDSVLEDQGVTARPVPFDFQKVFAQCNVAAESFLLRAAELAERSVLVQNGQVTEAVFPVTEVIHNSRTGKMGFYARVTLGAVLIIALGAIIIGAN